MLEVFVHIFYFSHKHSIEGSFAVLFGTNSHKLENQKSHALFLLLFEFTDGQI